MRIIVLGDFHLDPDDYGITREAMEDIERAAPDLVVPLGDFGSRCRIGGVEGLHEVKPFLDMISAPKRPILGNHDLQRESGDGRQPKGTMEAELLRLFPIDKPYGVLEYDDFRLFFASTEPQPADSCYSLQECYATEEQFSRIVGELDKRPGIPVIFFTHAPPIGCGLRTVPRVHVKSTNAFLDQNHNPYRWRQLFERYPEIVMWFSAHYHLGHGYPDSHTVRGGTHFFMTGVHGSCTRDETRVSRVIDISEGRVNVLTLDHVKRSVTEEGAFSYDGPLKSMAGPGLWPPVPRLSAGLDEPGARLERVADCSVGETPALPFGLHALDGGKYVVTTEDGFTWEVEPEAEAVHGSLHIGEPLRALAVSGGSVWMSWADRVGRSELPSPWRFVRSLDGEWPQRQWPLGQAAACLTPHPDGGVWIGFATRVARFDADGGAGPALELPAEPVQLAPDGRGVWILCGDGTLWSWNGAGEAARLEQERVCAFDLRDGACAALVQAGESVGLKWLGAQGQTAEAGISPLPGGDAERAGDAPAARLVVLGSGKAAALIAGTVYYWARHGASPIALDALRGRAAALCRTPLPNGGDCGFAVCTAVDPRWGRPRLELWASRA